MLWFVVLVFRLVCFVVFRLFQLPPIGFPIDPVPGRLVGRVELVLDLLDTVPSRHQEPGQNEGIGFLLGGLEFLAGFLLEALVPGFALLVAPVKVLGRPQDFSVQAESLLAVRGESPGRAGLGNPHVGRHDWIGWSWE